MSLTDQQAAQAFKNCVNLPAVVFFDHDTEGLCMITRGEEGYTRLYSAESAAAFNTLLRITSNQEAAMLNGSMFGFHTPAADPQHPLNMRRA